MMTVACVLCSWWKVKSIVFFHLNSKWWQFLCLWWFFMCRQYHVFLCSWKEYCFLSFEIEILTTFMYTLISCTVETSFRSEKHRKKTKKNWMISFSLSSKIILLRFLCQPLHTQILYCSFSNFSSYVTHSNLDIIKK